MSTQQTAQGTDEDLAFLWADSTRLEKFRDQLNSPELSRQEWGELSDDAIRVLIGEARLRARSALGREPSDLSTGLFKNLLQLYFTIWHLPSLEWLARQTPKTMERQSSSVS